MLAKHLLRFIREKVAKEGDTVVLVGENKTATLNQVFELMGIPLAYFTLDALDVKASTHFKAVRCYNQFKASIRGLTWGGVFFVFVGLLPSQVQPIWT